MARLLFWVACGVFALDIGLIAVIGNPVSMVGFALSALVAANAAFTSWEYVL